MGKTINLPAGGQNWRNELPLYMQEDYQDHHLEDAIRRTPDISKPTATFGCYISTAAGNTTITAGRVLWINPDTSAPELLRVIGSTLTGVTGENNISLKRNKVTSVIQATQDASPGSSEVQFEYAFQMVAGDITGSDRGFGLDALAYGGRPVNAEDSAKLTDAQLSLYFDDTGLGKANPYLGWAICNGSNGTIDERGRMRRFGLDGDTVGAQGGADAVDISESNLPVYDPGGGTNYTQLLRITTGGNNTVPGGDATAGEPDVQNSRSINRYGAQDPTALDIRNKFTNTYFFQKVR